MEVGKLGLAIYTMGKYWFILIRSTRQKTAEGKAP